jgi:hypothetical protein
MGILSGFANFCGRLGAATVGLVSVAIAAVGLAASIYTGGTSLLLTYAGVVVAGEAFKYAFRPLNEDGPKKSSEDSQTFEQSHSRPGLDDDPSEYRDNSQKFEQSYSRTDSDFDEDSPTQPPPLIPVTSTVADIQRVQPEMESSVVVRPTPVPHHAIIKPAINFLAEENIKKMHDTLQSYKVTDSPKPADNTTNKTAPYKSVETDHGNFKIYKDKLTTDSKSVAVFTDMLRSFDAANKGKTPKITASSDPEVAKNLKDACIAVYGPNYLEKVTIVAATPVTAPALLSSTAKQKTQPTTEPEIRTAPAMGRRSA